MLCFSVCLGSQIDERYYTLKSRACLLDAHGHDLGTNVGQLLAAGECITAILEMGIDRNR